MSNDSYRTRTCWVKCRRNRWIKFPSDSAWISIFRGTSLEKKNVFWISLDTESLKIIMISGLLHRVCFTASPIRVNRGRNPHTCLHEGSPKGVPGVSRTRQPLLITMLYGKCWVREGLQASSLPVFTLTVVCFCLAFCLREEHSNDFPTTALPPPPHGLLPISPKPSGRTDCVWQRNMSFLRVPDLGSHPRPPFPGGQLSSAGICISPPRHCSRGEKLPRQSGGGEKQNARSLHFPARSARHLRCQEPKAEKRFEIYTEKNINTTTLSLSAPFSRPLLTRERLFHIWFNS